jgi:hypothetical protein
MENPYCRLYVQSAASLEALQRLVVVAATGDVASPSQVLRDVLIDVRISDDYDVRGVERDPTHFVYYRYSVDVQATAVTPVADFLDLVSLLMRAIESEGANVVASCDWEDELPGSGKLGPDFHGDELSE